MSFCSQVEYDSLNSTFPPRRDNLQLPVGELHCSAGSLVTTCLSPSAASSSGPSLDSSMEAEEQLEHAKEALKQLFQAMDQGWVADWVDTFLEEDVELTVAGKMHDRSEDRSCRGKDKFVEYYNNVLRRVWEGPESTVTWNEMQAAGVEGEGVYLDFLIHTARASGDTTKRRRYTVQFKPGSLKAMGIIVGPVCQEDDMDEELLACRTCVPECLPCSHNTWDSVRAKRKFTLLRCRTCNASHRMHASEAFARRCLPFSKAASCPAGSSCAKLHIFPRKQRAHERVSANHSGSSDDE